MLAPSSDKYQSCNFCFCTNPQQVMTSMAFILGRISVLPRPRIVRDRKHDGKPLRCTRFVDSSRQPDLDDNAEDQRTKISLRMGSSLLCSSNLSRIRCVAVPRGLVLQPDRGFPSLDQRGKKKNNKKKKKCADDSYASCVKVHKRVNRNANPRGPFCETITAQLMIISCETESRVKPRVRAQGDT